MDALIPPEADERRQRLAEQLATINRYEALSAFFRAGEGSDHVMRWDDPAFAASLQLAVTFSPEDEARHGADVAREAIIAMVRVNIGPLMKAMFESQALALRQLLAEKA